MTDNERKDNVNENGEQPVVQPIVQTIERARPIQRGKIEEPDPAEIERQRLEAERLQEEEKARLEREALEQQDINGKTKKAKAKSGAKKKTKKESKLDKWAAKFEKPDASGPYAVLSIGKSFGTMLVMALPVLGFIAFSLYAVLSPKIEYLPTALMIAPAIIGLFIIVLWACKMSTNKSVQNLAISYLLVLLVVMVIVSVVFMVLSTVIPNLLNSTLQRIINEYHLCPSPDQSLEPTIVPDTTPLLTEQPAVGS